MNWKLKPGLWECDPFTIQLQFCERRRVEMYELYDNTRFDSTHESVAKAKARAEELAS